MGLLLIAYRKEPHFQIAQKQLAFTFLLHELVALDQSITIGFLRGMSSDKTKRNQVFR